MPLVNTYAMGKIFNNYLISLSNAFNKYLALPRQ